MSNTKKWVLNIEEDPDTGDSIIVLPADLLEETGWKEGDNLIWLDRNDGSWQLIKEDLTNFIKKGIIKNEQN